MNEKLLIIFYYVPIIVLSVGYTNRKIKTSWALKEFMLIGGEHIK